MPPLRQPRLLQPRPSVSRNSQGEQRRQSVQGKTRLRRIPRHGNTHSAAGGRDSRPPSGWGEACSARNYRDPGEAIRRHQEIHHRTFYPQLGERMISFSNHQQGTPEWISERRGIVTGSRFKDARDKLKGGQPSKACLAYAMDIARERAGGAAPSKFQNSAMRIGTEEEPRARMAYERRTGNLVNEVGFFYTDDHLFGGLWTA